MSSVRAIVDQYLSVFPDEMELQKPIAEFVRRFSDHETIDRKNFVGHLTASALVVNRERAEVLLIKHKFLARWLQPGGHHEPGQSLWASAVREAMEETGVTALSEHPHFGTALPLDIDSHAIPANRSKGEGAHWHHDYAYLMIAPLGVALSPQLAEVNAVAWRPLASLDVANEARWRSLVGKLGLFSPRA